MHFDVPSNQSSQLFPAKFDSKGELRVIEGRLKLYVY